MAPRGMLYIESISLGEPKLRLAPMALRPRKTVSWEPENKEAFP